MKIGVLRSVAIVATVCCVGVTCMAAESSEKPQAVIPQDFELSNGSRIHIGGDLRMRWETIDPQVVNPDAKDAPASSLSMVAFASSTFMRFCALESRSLIVTVPLFAPSSIVS